MYIVVLFKLVFMWFTRGRPYAPHPSKAISKDSLFIFSFVISSDSFQEEWGLFPAKDCGDFITFKSKSGRTFVLNKLITS